MSSRCLTSVFMRIPIFSGLLDGVPFEEETCKETWIFKIDLSPQEEEMGNGCLSYVIFPYSNRTLIICFGTQCGASGVGCINQNFELFGNIHKIL